MKIKFSIIYYILTGIVTVSCTTQTDSTINMESSILQLGDLPENPLLLTPLSTGIQPKNSSMFTVYGNYEAVQYYKQVPNSTNFANAAIYKVTWKQKEDEVWFGGNIPAQIKSVERVTFNKEQWPVYELYTGVSMKKVMIEKQKSIKRANEIMTQKIAVLP